MSTARQHAAKSGVTCESCIEEALIRMQIFTGWETELPMYKVKDFLLKLEDQFWLHNAMILKVNGIQ